MYVHMLLALNSIIILYISLAFNNLMAVTIMFKLAI